MININAMRQLSRQKYLSLFFLICWIAGAYAQSDTNAAIGNKVIVSGVLPDEKTRLVIVAKLRDTYGADRVVDRTTIEKLNMPKDWLEQVLKSIKPQLKQVTTGKLAITQNTVSLSGTIPDAASKKAIANEMMASMGSQFQFADQTSLFDNGQSSIDSLLENRHIEFEIGSAKLSQNGRVLLDEIFGILKGIKTLNHVDVSGHTDNDGSRIHNLNLSLARANSVKFYLASKGIREDIITVHGYGPDRPITSNDTNDGRAHNRRIEVKTQ